MRGVLFEKLKLAKGKKTKKGYSTTAEILESIEHLHPVVPMILRFRQVQKLDYHWCHDLRQL